jgi:hypothetical protein
MYPSKTYGKETHFSVGTVPNNPKTSFPTNHFVDGYDSHYLYETLLVNLIPDTVYYYRAGNDGVRTCIF